MVRHWFEGKNGEILKHVLLGIVVILMVLLALDYLAAEFPQVYESAEAFIRQYGLLGVFAIVFLGSTLLPAPTDASFAIAIKFLPGQEALVIAVAVVAAFLAAMVNYYLAFFFRQKFIKRFMSKKDLAEAQDLFNKYGPIPIVLFGIIPASPVFDPLTLVAGLVRMDVRKFALYSLISRVLHFVGLAVAVLAFNLF